MNKKGAEMVVSHVVLFVLLLVVLALLIMYVGKNFSRADQGTTCEGQGYECKENCGDYAPIGLKCANPLKPNCCPSES